MPALRVSSHRPLRLNIGLLRDLPVRNVHSLSAQFCNVQFTTMAETFSGRLSRLLPL